MKLKMFVACIISLISFSTLAASFDCHQAKYADEKTICSTPALNDLDVEMSVKYHFLHGLFAMGAAGALKDEQDTWLIERRQCQVDIGCLTNQYQKRIKTLNDLYNAIDKPI